MAQSNEAQVGNMVVSSATGTTFLILIQLASRIFTFASNQLILRALSPTVLGVAAQLELYQVSILYFSRESIRMAIQRQPVTSDSSAPKKNSAETPEKSDQAKNSIASQSVVNVSYLSILLGIPFAILFTTLYHRFASEQISGIPFFDLSVNITGLAALLELTIEPFFAVVQQRMWYEKRAAVEMPAAFFKSLTTCGFFLYSSRTGQNAGALPFALGHLTYSITLICGYSISLLRAKDRRFSFLPSFIKSR